jgi:hypothetical protein
VHGQCRHEEVYIEQFLLLVVQVEITITTAMPHGLAGWGALLSALPAGSVIRTTT